ncbi:MAG: DUF6273 domain-containing protein [Oscillospiraceae bacterium]|nr:DUF6273 domain-containing protein [Oscillospiraceae bacterium]
MSFLKKLLNTPAPPKANSAGTAAVAVNHNALLKQQISQSQNQILQSVPHAKADMFGRALLPFGTYPQTADGQCLPIMWIVLNPSTCQNDGGMLLLSEKILDCAMFHSSEKATADWHKGDSPVWDVPMGYSFDDYKGPRLPYAYEYYATPEVRWPPDPSEYWKHSDIGKWLNGSSWAFESLSAYPKKHRTDWFYDNAFTDSDKEKIIDKGIGKVFLLSLDEIRQYRGVLSNLDAQEWERLSDDRKPAQRRAVGSDYIKNDNPQLKKARDKCVLDWNDFSNSVTKYNEAQDAVTFLPTGDLSNPCSTWWLRTAGDHSTQVLFVLKNGGIGMKDRDSLTAHWRGVRPAIWVQGV